MTNHLKERMDDIYDNPQLLKFYAKHNCKHCYGRGTLTHNIVAETGQWFDKKTLCDCVKKAVQKETKELEQIDG